MPSLRRRPRGHVGWLNTQQLIVKQLASSETGDCQQSMPSADHRGQRAANPKTNEVNADDGKQNMVPLQLILTKPTLPSSDTFPCRVHNSSPTFHRNPMND